MNFIEIEDYAKEILNEQYFGKNKNLKELEKVIEECIALSTKNVFPSTNKLNNILLRSSKIIEDEFGFNSCLLRVTDSVCGINAFTIPQYHTMRLIKKPKVISTKNGVKYIDKSVSLYCVLGKDTFKGTITAEEIVAIIMHEIGHNFYLNNNDLGLLYKINDDVFTIMNNFRKNNITNGINDDVKQIIAATGISFLTPVVAKIFDSSPVFRKIYSLFLEIQGIRDRVEMEIYGFKGLYWLLTKFDKYHIRIQHALRNSIKGFNPFDFIYSTADEKFADNFASSYGYGIALSTGLQKNTYAKGSTISNKMCPMLSDILNGPLNTIYRLLDCHPEAYSRALNQYKYLKSQLDNIDDPELKKELSVQVEECKYMIDKYKDTMVNESMENRKYFTAAYYGLLLSIPYVAKNGIGIHNMVITPATWKQLETTVSPIERIKGVFSNKKEAVTEELDLINSIMGNYINESVNINSSLDSAIQECISTIGVLYKTYNIGNNYTKCLEDLSDKVEKMLKCAGFDQNIELSILTDNGADMFGARCIVDSNNLLKISGYLIKDKKVSDYIKHVDNTLNASTVKIELDHCLFEQYNKFNFKDREILAIILHEIGHAKDREIYTRLYTSYHCAVQNFNNNNFKIKYNCNTISLCSLYIVTNMYEDTLFSKDRKSISLQELKADGFVKHFGTLPELNSAIDTFIKSNCFRYISKTNKQMDVTARMFVQSCKTYFDRKRHINKLILREKLMTTSNIIKDTLDTIAKHTLKNNDNYKYYDDNNVYCTDDGIGGIVNEGFDFFSKFKSNPNKVSSYDIDSLRISTEMVNDVDDKQILIYKIYKRKNQILEMLNDKIYIESHPDEKMILESYLNTLNQLHSQVMSIKVNTIQRYGVFIKYPKGYEG